MHRGAEGHRRAGFGLTGMMGSEHGKLVAEATHRLDQPVQRPRLLKLIQPTEPMQHALPDAAVDAFVFDDQQVLPAAVALDSQEHGDLRVITDDTQYSY